MWMFDGMLMFGERRGVEEKADDVSFNARSLVPMEVP